MRPPKAGNNIRGVVVARQHGVKHGRSDEDPDASEVEAGACPQGWICNEAAVCSPCVKDVACGAQCEDCMGRHCLLTPTDPNNPLGAKCVECKTDLDCKRGQVCNGVNICVSPPVLLCPEAPFLIAPDPDKPTVIVPSP